MSHPILQGLLKDFLEGAAIPDRYQQLFGALDDALSQLTSHTKIREGQLEKENSHLKAMQAVAKAGSWEVSLVDDFDSAANYWSDQLYSILGVEPGTVDLSYDNYIKLVHPEDRDMFVQNLNRAVTGTGKYDIDYRILRPDGTERIVRDVGQTLTDGDGVPLKMVGITFDITDARNSEIALSQANFELRTLFDTMGEVFYSVEMRNNQNSRLLQMSPACKIVYGYEIAEFFQDSDLWFKVILDQDKHLVTEGLPRLITGETTCSEYRILHKDGTIRWLESKITPTLNDQGELVRIDGINSNITKRKEAEFGKLQTDLRFRALIENSMDAITVADEQLNFTFVSDSMSVMTGFSREETLGASILDYIHQDDHKKVQDLVRPLFAQPGTPQRFEMRMKRKDGQWIWTDGYVSNLLNEAAVGGYIANFRDVTERKTHDAALEESNAQLKKTNEELDRFVYSVSHDLRAPLASVMGLIEYTESETDDQDILENLVMMKESIKKLDIFILDILDYARNARMEVKRQRIDFAELLEEIRSNLKFMNTTDTPVEIRISIPDNAGFYSDRRRIHVILNNLVSNAIRYFDPQVSEPFVQVSVEFDRQGAWLNIKDNGIGIDKAHHERIFDMFYRVSRKSNGSGLGLYLVRETVGRLGGTVNFESEPKLGTQFSIFLPNLNRESSHGI
ncbi:MAG TPA: PAS domain-containing protein [Pedobacter sp.]|nr:PAS domain-containing protein [Pedobacter sp.]